MNKYQRTQSRGSYKNITIVDDAGNYEQYNEFSDGMKMGYIKTTLQKMGWMDTKEFLKHKKGFEICETV